MNDLAKNILEGCTLSPTEPLAAGFGYARTYQTSDQRAAHLPEWTHSYNWHRPHGGIGSEKPISRLGLTGDNLLRLHI